MPQESQPQKAPRRKPGRPLQFGEAQLFKLAPAEKDAWRAMAKEAGITVSDAIRVGTRKELEAAVARVRKEKASAAA